MPFTRITVQEQYETSIGTPAAGSVEFTPVDQMHNGSLVISAPESDILDSSGNLSISLAATTDPATTPVGVTYRVVERILGQPVRTYYVAVPHDQGSPLQLADLPSSSTGGTAGFALRNAIDYDDGTPPVDGQAMVWDSTTSKFHPESVSGVGSTVTAVNGQTGAVTVSPANIGAQPVDSDLTTIAALSPADGTLLERVGGAWTARTAAQVKGDLALDLVNNTTDLAKPLSTAATAALAVKAPLADPTFTGTPTAPRFVPAVASVAYAASVTLDASTASTFRVSASGDITSIAISNGAQGQQVRLQVFATGADRAVTAFGVATTVPSGTWRSLSWTYNQGSNVWIPDSTTVGGAGTGAVSSVNGQTGAVSVTASSLGAQPVDSDLTTIGALAPTDGSLLSRQGGVWTGRTVAQTKLDMALDQVDNTTDANKPISNATAASLAVKAPLASPAFTGTPSAPRFVGAVQVVTYASSVTLDAGLATTFRVTATGPLTVTDIIGGANGQLIALEVFASGADRVLTIAGAAITVTAGQWWVGALRYDSAVDTWKLSDASAAPNGSGGSGGVPDDGSVTNAKVATNAAIDLDKTIDSATRVAMTPAERTALSGLSTERIQDDAAALLTGGVHSGIAFTYNDVANRVDATVTGAVGAGGDLLSVTQPSIIKLAAGLADRHVTPCRIVFVGSSTTAGQNASVDSARYVNRLIARVQAGYPSGLPVEAPVLSVTAGAAAVSLLPGAHGYNGGTGSTTSANYLDTTAITNIGTLNPTMVLHMVGSNDYSAGVAPATYKTNVQARITSLKSVITGPCVHLLVHAFQRLDVTSPAFAWSSYGQQLSDIAAADPDNVAFLDLSTHYAQAGVPGTDPLNLVDTDNTHQTDAGHAFMADLIGRGLRLPDGRLRKYAVVDTFSRADGALGSTDSGQVWTVLSGTWAIASGQAAPSAVGTAVVDAGLADLDVSCLITPQATGNPGLVFRAVDDLNRLGVFLDPTNGVALFRTVAGAATVLASSAQTFTAGRPYLVRVVANGTSIVAYLDGVPRISYTLSSGDLTTFGAATQVGARIASAAPAGVRFGTLSVRALNDPPVVWSGGGGSVGSGAAFQSAMVTNAGPFMNALGIRYTIYVDPTTGAWPNSGSRVVPSGFTGSVIWDSMTYVGATAPTGMIDGDLWDSRTA